MRLQEAGVETMLRIQNGRPALVLPPPQTCAYMQRPVLSLSAVMVAAPTWHHRLSVARRKGIFSVEGALSAKINIVSIKKKGLTRLLTF
jgi:hypothetical protein